MKFSTSYFILFLSTLILIISSLLISSCFFNSSNSTDPLSCKIDSDCVPASCCHAVSAVNQKNAPSCENIFCTEECRPNTLDCNQAEIKCLNNQCAVIIKNIISID